MKLIIMFTYEEIYIRKFELNMWVYKFPRDNLVVGLTKLEKLIFIQFDQSFFIKCVFLETKRYFTAKKHKRMSLLKSCVDM